MELWHDYVSVAAECLLKANDDPESEAGKRLVRTLPGSGSEALYSPDSNVGVGRTVLRKQAC
jgi:hypothetical protein